MQQISVIPEIARLMLPDISLKGYKGPHRTTLLLRTTQVDFIGVTTYSSAAPNFHTREIAKAMEEFEKEASIMGLKLKDLLRNRCTPIHFTEFGVGGG